MYVSTRLCLAKEGINNKINTFALGTVQSAQTYASQIPCFVLHLQWCLLTANINQCRLNSVNRVAKAISLIHGTWLAIVLA